MKKFTTSFIKKNSKVRTQSTPSSNFKKNFLLLLGLPILFGFSIPLSELGARIFSQREISLQGMPLQSLLLEERKHRQKGNMYFTETRYEEALVEYNKALQIIPYKFETLYNKACILALLDKKQEALQTLKIAALIHNYAVDLAIDDSDLDNLRGMDEFKEFITWEEE